MSSLILALPPRLDLETVARLSHVHPDVVERFVELGLVPGDYDLSGHLWFHPSAPARIRMVVRLHADLSLNYTAVALVIDLLVRIDELENRRWITPQGKDSRPWR